VLDPDIQRVLDAMNGLPTVAPEDVPVTQARAAHIAETAELAGEGPAVAEVRELAVDGPGGPIGIRSYRPDGARGTIAYLHGGGWVVGNLDSVDAVCRALAVAAGATVASIDYRLAPEHPFPAAIDDALAALRHLSAGEPALAVAGDSAGANLATVAARRLRGEPALRAQLLVYPVTDAGINTASYREFDDGHGLSAAAMRHFWELYLGGADGSHPDASPLRAAAGDLAGMPPAYVLTAEEDVLRDEGEAYADALERAGVAVTRRRRAGTIHGFWRWQAASAAARDAVREAGAAMRSALDA
jgi:acetyl esterase